MWLPVCTGFNFDGRSTNDEFQFRVRMCCSPILESLSFQCVLLARLFAEFWRGDQTCGLAHAQVMLHHLLSVFPFALSIPEFLSLFYVHAQVYALVFVSNSQTTLIPFL